MNVKQIGLRLSDDLHRKFKAKAKQNGRSLHTELVENLKCALNIDSLRAIDDWAAKIGRRFKTMDEVALHAFATANDVYTSLTIIDGHMRKTRELMGE